MKRIAVIGSGYVGLVTGTCFAETGNHVICVDNNDHKLERLRKGEIPIYEPMLDVLFQRNIKSGRLTFTNDLQDALLKSDIIFLALPTPPGEDGSADLSYVLGVATEIGKYITDFKVIVDKSTVPVGTAALVMKTIAAETKIEFAVVSNPEFLREGFAVEDFLNPERIIIGSEDDRAIQAMTELYQPFAKDGHQIIVMDEKSAELTKYAANAFLATKITFMNEVANFCEKVGADVDKVRIGIGSDSRIGHKFLYPGIGYGGSCFPKDVSALVKSGEKEASHFKILESVLKINEEQKTVIIEKLINYFGDLTGKKFALWGLAFKPDTDDIREASALYIIDKLRALGATVTAHDPQAMNNVRTILGDKIAYTENQYDALEGADALIIATEWMQFRNADFAIIKEKLNAPVIFDGRNIYELAQMEKFGFYYNSIGRKIVQSMIIV